MRSACSGTSGRHRRCGPPLFCLAKFPSEFFQILTPACAQITSAIAAIVLSEKLGFNVELVDGLSGKDMYAALADGTALHLAFEAWPASNAKIYEQYADGVQVKAFAYANLFGRSGLFEVPPRESPWLHMR